MINASPHSLMGNLFGRKSGSKSENQRIKLQRRKEYNPILPGKKLECLSLGMVVVDYTHLIV